MTHVETDERRQLLDRYGRWYGEERFAVAFTATNTGDGAKRITTPGWDKTLPLADGDHGAAILANRGLKRNPCIVLRPSNLIVLECDTEADLVRIQDLDLPVTITVCSSRPYKRHFYYRPAPELEALPFVAFRFESGKLTADTGRYFLAPPSLHPSGVTYAFLSDRGPDDVDITELPETVYRDLSLQAREETDGLKHAIAEDPDAKFKAGTRGDAIFRYACMLRRWGLPRDLILDHCLTYNKTKCEPPIEQERVEMQVDGAMKKTGGQELARPDEPPEDPPARPRLTIVSLQQFVTDIDDVPEPLIGTRDESLLPTNGTLLMYGDGGAGKTTLTIDAAAHLAAGVTWLGITITRAANVLLIENEGPREPFQHRLDRKITEFPHEFAHRVNVMKDPWTRFTLTDPEYRADLANAITATNTDIVIVGPLASIGAKGTGTPDDVNDFDELVQDLRAKAARQFALWIVHHENKAGDVSGAWERYPDSLVHVQSQGNGRTRVHWRKIRWASSLHGTSSNLVWADGASFTVEEQVARDVAGELQTAFEKTDQWRTAKEAAVLIGANVDNVKTVLSQLVDQGVMQYAKGPQGRRPNAQCWRLKTDSDPLSQSESLSPSRGAGSETDSLTRPIYESESESVESAPMDSNGLGLNSPESLQAEADRISDQHHDDELPF